MTDADFLAALWTWRTALNIGAGLVAGCVDAIAGGGGLITIPSLLASGVPPAAVLGTSKLQSTFGAGLAAWRFAREPGLLDGRTLARGACWTLAGAAAGTLVVTRLSPAALARIIPVLLAAVAVYVLVSPRFHDEDRPGHLSPSAAFALLGLVIGFYDGFFGPGTGSFWAVGLVSLAGYGLTRATGYTKAMNFASNVISLALFFAVGTVLIVPGLEMAVGQAAGAWIGARLALRGGARLIRPILGVMSLLVSVWLVVRLSS